MISLTFFRHLSDSRYCFSIDESHTLIRLAVSKLCPLEKVELIYGDPQNFSNDHHNIKMEIRYEDKTFLYYEVIVHTYPMRLMYLFKIRSDGKDYYLCENDIYETFNYDLSFLNTYQFIGENKNDYVLEKPSWKGRVFYQIFPERFAYRENCLDKSYVNTSWNEDHLAGRHNAFLGGDLLGVIDKLDYLSDLGISAIYLTPIHPSQTNHKYDVLDYYDVDPQFGGKEAFRELVDKAHEKGMKVMMDFVFNHCSHNNPIFLDVKEKGRESKYYDWFFINGDKPHDFPLNYLCFAKAKYMPKLNTNNRDLQEYLIKVGEFWVKEFDIDGVRLDVSEGVSHDFWNRFKLALVNIKPDILVIGENWLNSESYLNNNQFDGVMNYPFLSTLSSYLLGLKNSKETSFSLQQLLMRYKDGNNRMMMNILGSHDIQRMMNLVHDKDLSLLGYAIMVFYLGYPMIYYGEEIFMEGGRDPDNRHGMRWDSEEFSSYQHQVLKQLLHLRKESPLAEGEISFYESSGLLIIKRHIDKQAIEIICNRTDKPIKLNENPIIQNRFENGDLLPKGFIIVRR